MRLLAWFARCSRLLAWLARSLPIAWRVALVLVARLAQCRLTLVACMCVFPGESHVRLYLEIRTAFVRLSWMTLSLLFILNNLPSL